MKRIVTTLVLSVIVFVSTILATILYVSRQSLEAADYYNAQALDNFQSELNSDILLTEQSARNFLSGIPFVSVGSDSTSFAIEENDLPLFREMIGDVLPQFMKINQYYENSMFIIDRDICRNYFQSEGTAYHGHCLNGFVPFVRKGDNRLYDLSDQLDLMGSVNYQQIKRDRKILWTTSLPAPSGEGRLFTLLIPLTLSNGMFFGAFALSMDVKVVNDKLKKHLPYGEGNCAMFIVDENDNIFSSTPEWIMAPDNQEIIRNKTDILKRHDSGKEYNVLEYEGEVFYIYQRNLPVLSWRIFTFNMEDAIYREARRILMVVVLSSVIGMLLMLVCCIVIFRQIRENLHRKTALEEELRMASKVQTSILKPSDFMFINNSSPVSLHAFMQPAKEVGGDLYDYQEKDGKLVFCIGDVSGKGMPAALFMAQVVSLFRNAVRFTSEPSEIVSQVNDALSDNHDMTFCTFFVAVLCGNEIRFCNAGHNPPLIITSDTAYLNMRPNLAMGLKEGYPYRQETIAFNPGDRLVLYTDGVTEAKGKGKQRYGDERLLNIVSSLPQNVCADSINTHITNSIKEFVEKEEQSDDITIVSIVNAAGE